MQRIRALLIIATFAAFGPAIQAPTSSAAPLDDAVRAALVRIEQEPVDPLLLPALATTDEEPEVVDRRRLAIARSVLTMHAQIDTTIAVLEGDVLTMLSLARNTRHLGMRARALRLYELTVLADRDHRYTREILEERVKCAIELGDSTAVVDLAFEVVDRPDAAGYGDALAASLEFLTATPSIGAAVRRLADRMQALASLDHVTAQIRIAQLRQRLDEHSVANTIYRGLLLRQRDLDAHQVAICLMGLADSTYAMGDAARARELYRSYREHNAGRLSAWSTYQLGNMAASAGDFDQAVSLLRSICEREETTPWRDSACTRLAQVRQLVEIEAALRPFGRDLSPARKSR